jgi:glycosylphosphatidylinositol transamidase
MPYISSAVLSSNTTLTPTPQQYLLIKSFSLVLLGLCLSTLATLNFSLAFLIGVLSVPLTFVSRLPGRPLMAGIVSLILNGVSPPVVLFASCWYFEVPVQKVLMEAAFGWDVWGMWTQVVVWCVWWPAWVVGGFQVASSVTMAD